jgi:hypothetical protein
MEMVLHLRNSAGNLNLLYLQLYSDGKIYCTLCLGGRESMLAASEAAYGLSPGKWHMVTQVWDGSEFRNYVDGVERISKSHPGKALDLTAGTQGFGAQLHKKDRRYNGLLDEVGLWDRALSESEIRSLYNSGKGLAYPF